MQVIYRIRNVVNGKFYVGSTVREVHRFRDHRRLLRRGTHHCKYLQSAWNKYGEECFKFEIVETVPDGESLQAAEDRWLAEHFDQSYCYNTGRRSDAPWRGGEKENHPNFGRGKSDAAKKAISDALKAYYAEAPENHPRYGKKHTPEALAKMALKVVRRGESHYRYGKTVSDEVKKKISDAQKGKPKGPRVLTEEGRAKILAAAAAGHYSHAKGRKRGDEECEYLRRSVVERSTGQAFGSLTEALAHFGMLMPTLQRALKSGRPISKGPHAGLQFDYDGAAGIFSSEETKAKKSAAMKLAWERRKAKTLTLPPTPATLPAS